MDALTRDIAALVNIILGVMVWIFWMLAAHQFPMRRWRPVMYLAAVMGLAWAVVSLFAIMRIYSSGGIIDPAIGRPVTTLTLLALVMLAILQFGSRGNRK